MKIYLVLWSGNNGKEWHSDGIFCDRKIAEAKLEFEKLNQPRWIHLLVEAEVPSLEEAELEQA